ncbi:hypothetical protein NIES267_33650 [Calothrix parasitica NIES-267]|uniref:Uncharacterized protein n=1 Tax=Calothrix parasitica NIES-267 TaxID=1973488 RepID=A0A1Z4LRU0_9CYAN|nr:hypothetical protein NIES267_33650 [Calothrix parasitica NIES-267]
MSQLNYETMPDAELLTYVRQHPEDKQAFYTYVDRKRSASGDSVPMSVEEAEAELERRIRKQK